MFNKNGRSIKEDICLICRGLKEFDKMLPGQMKYVAWKSVLTALLPCVAVVLSALILNELTGGQDKGILGFFVLFSTGLTWILSNIICGLEAKIAVGYNRLFSSHEIFLTEKAHRLPFYLLERQEVRSLREQVSGSIQTSGGGMASLYWDMASLVSSLCLAAAALVLCLGFGIRSGGISSGNLAEGGVFASLFALTALCVFVSVIITRKRFDVSFETFEHGAKYRRYGDFYDMRYLPDEASALDVRIYRQKNLVLEESRKKCYQPFADGKAREMRALSGFEAVRLLCMGVCGIAVYGVSEYLALGGGIEIGSVVAVYSAVMMLVEALSHLAQTMADLRNNNVHLLRYFAYMDLEEEGNAGDVGEQRILEDKTDTHNLKIEFQDVSFQYPGSTVEALKNVSLEIRPGERLALVGENGSGKSTLVKLLCRLYRPACGRILLDGRDIWEYPYEDYIKKITVVFQDFALFALSLAENIAASEHYDRKRVYEALRETGLLGKADSLEKGIEQAVSQDYEEDGVQLSGGEAQKTAIARAVYKGGGILILDEPAAALDPFAEAEIYEQFFGRRTGGTTLSISHRLSSCRLCDRIIVLEKGALTQQGTHEELVSENGAYARLWEQQAQYYS